VLISGGTPKREDYAYENEVYRAVAEAFVGLEVDVMMFPQPGLLDIEQLHSIGINGLSINLELYNVSLAKRVMPLKARLDRRQFFDFERFGGGKVRSLLLVGLESTEDTLNGVRALAQRGCDPVLSPFRPDPATPMHNMEPPTVQTLAEVYERSLETTEAHGVKLGPRCIPCHHNTLTFPDGSSAYYYSSRFSQL
jgi:hypothetical protein